MAEASPVGHLVTATMTPSVVSALLEKTSPKPILSEFHMRPWKRLFSLHHLKAPQGTALGQQAKLLH